MANIPCPIHVNCPPSPGSLEFDSPLANFSSEAPDQNLFIGINYGWDVNIPNLGWTWNNGTSIGVCESPVSQAVANQCAQNNQLTNLTGGGGEFPNDGWVNQTGNPVQPAFNQQQAASFVCPDGLLFTWIVAAGSLNALNQAVANAIAFNQAVQNANAHYICLGSLTNTATAGTPYSSTASTTRGPQVKAPLSIGVISGNLPPGLVAQQSADSFSFILSGTPTTPGTFNFTLQATDANGNFMQKAYTITVSSSCNVFWNSLLPLWQPSTIGALSQAFIIGNTVTILGDATGIALGFAQLQAIANAPLSQALTCSITARLIQNANPPTPANEELLLVVQDSISGQQFLAFTANGNNLPLLQTFQFTVPKGSTPLVSFALQTVGQGGPDAILQYAITLNPS